MYRLEYVDERVFKSNEDACLYCAENGIDIDFIESIELREDELKEWNITKEEIKAPY